MTGVPEGLEICPEYYRNFFQRRPREGYFTPPCSPHSSLNSVLTMRYLLLFLLLTASAFAQKEYSRWYFGIGYGLNFNVGSPPDTSQGHNSQLFYEGSAGICNPSTGDLLFYTKAMKLETNVVRTIRSAGKAIPGENRIPKSLSQDV